MRERGCHRRLTGMYLRIEPAPLSEKCSCDEPEAVAHAKLILDDFALGQTRMGIVPLVRTEAGHYEEGETDEHVSRQYVQPYLDGEGIHEGEETGRLAGRYLNYVRLQF